MFRGTRIWLSHATGTPYAHLLCMRLTSVERYPTFAAHTHTNVDLGAGRVQGEVGDAQHVVVASKHAGCEQCVLLRRRPVLDLVRSLTWRQSNQPEHCRQSRCEPDSTSQVTWLRCLCAAQCRVPGICLKFNTNISIFSAPPLSPNATHACLQQQGPSSRDTINRHAARLAPPT